MEPPFDYINSKRLRKDIKTISPLLNGKVDKYTLLESNQNEWDAYTIAYMSDEKLFFIIWSQLDINLETHAPNRNQHEIFNFKKADFQGLRTALRNDPLDNYLDNDSNVDDDKFLEDCTFW